MHKYKRAITLVLALLMVASVFFSLFSSLAYAAEIDLEVDDISSSNTIVISGTPSITAFGSTGKYNLKVTEDASNVLGLELVDEVTGSSIKKGAVDKNLFLFKQETSLNDTITLGGLTIKKTNGTPWTKDNLFTVVLRRKISSKEPMVSYNKTTAYRGHAGNEDDPNENARNNSAMYEITRNKEVNIHLTVADPTGGTLTDFFAIVEGGAFKTVSPTEVGGDNKLTTRIYSNPISLQNGRNGYEIDIVRLKYSGKGNSVAITYGYKVDGQPVEYSANITIPECVEYTRTPDKDEPDPDKTDPIVPHIIVSEYSYGAKQISAGQEFPLSITMTNTSSSLDLENIIMKVTTSTGDPTTSGKGGLSITSSSNTYYIPVLNKKASVTKEFNIRALPNAEPKSHDITIEFSFQYLANEKRQTSEKDKEVISIPVTQIDRFTVNPIEPPAYIYVGEEVPISATFVNKGRSDVYNVSAEIRGVQNSGQKQFIGNVESGKENSADFLVTANEPGELKGEIVITYEDGNLNTKEVIMPFSAMIQGMNFEPPIDPNPIGPMEPEVPASSKPDSKTISLGFAAVIIAALTAFVNVRKVKAKRMGDEDEDL